MKKVLTYKGAVMTWECDSNRHMNVMYYVNKFEHAGHNTNPELDIGEYNTDELGVVVLEQVLNYHKELFEDDIIYIESSLLDIGNKAFTIQHEMYNGQTKELCSTMKVVCVLFDKVNRRALPFPPDKKEELLKKIGK